MNLFIIAKSLNQSRISENIFHFLHISTYFGMIGIDVAPLFWGEMNFSSSQILYFKNLIHYLTCFQLKKSF